MKKFIIFVGAYLMFLAIPFTSEVDIKADSGIVKYQIYMDSEYDNSLEVKEEVNSILEYICNGVVEDSHRTMVKNNLSLFEKIENSHVRWKNATLLIEIGDGEGTHINGEYEKDRICIEEVKPKSKVLEWLGME